MSKKKPPVEIGERLADYYNPFRTFEVLRYGNGAPILGNKQAMPFDCPECGNPLHSLCVQWLEAMTKQSPVRLHCGSAEGCFRAPSMSFEDLKATVPQITEALASRASEVKAAEEAARKAAEKAALEATEKAARKKPTAQAS